MQVKGTTPPLSDRGQRCFRVSMLEDEHGAVYQGEVSGEVLLRAIAVTATTSSSASQVGRDDFDGNSLLLSKPARDRRPGILIFLARGQGAVEETVRGGRFMRKVADNTAEREIERERVSRSILERRRRRRSWKEAQDEEKFGLW